MDYLVVIASEQAIAMKSSKGDIAYGFNTAESWAREEYAEAYSSMIHWVINHIHGADTVFVTDMDGLNLLQDFCIDMEYGSYFQRMINYVAMIETWLAKHKREPNERSREELLAEAESVYDSFAKLLTDHELLEKSAPAGLWRRPSGMIPDVWELKPPEG